MVQTRGHLRASVENPALAPRRGIARAIHAAPRFSASFDVRIRKIVALPNGLNAGSPVQATPGCQGVPKRMPRATARLEHAARITHHASRTTHHASARTRDLRHRHAVRHGRHVSPRHDRHALTMRPAASAPARFPRPSSPRCRDAVNCRRPCAHYRSTIPEHERRAGDSSNECLPPRRPPAGSRCAPARATNAPRVAPTHAAVKRTETRARALLRHAASRPPCPRVDRSKTRRLAGRAFDRPFHTAVLAFPRLSQKYPQTGRSLHEKCSYFCAARDYIFGKTIKNC